MQELRERLLCTSLFEDGEYLSKYCDLIFSNFSTEAIKGQTQRHHIIPKCYYSHSNLEIDNSEANLVNLIFRDHILAHYYLMKASNTIWFKNSMSCSVCFTLGTARKIYKTLTDDQVLDLIEKANEYQIVLDEDARKKISVGMKKLRQEVGFSDEHRAKLKASQQNRICFIKGEKHTYTTLNKVDRINQLLADGWVIYDKQQAKNAGYTPFASRSIGCYCILDTGERFDFESICDAGKWWYENFKPFGEHYASATYQRKIEASMSGKEIKYALKNRKDYIIVTNIKWFSK